MDARPDYNVSHYTLSELLDMVHLTNDYLTPRHIQDTIGPMILKNRKTNPDLSLFLIQVQGELTRYSQGLQRNEAENADEEEEDEENDNEDNENEVEGFQTAEYPSGEKQVNEWYKNQTLTQTNNPTQTDKITQRKQKVGIFGNQHMPMKQEQLATTDTYTLPVKQDGLNPNLKNTITRFVNLDSQYRQYSNGTDGSTDYTLDLSDTLNNVLKLSIYSYQIPFCWYAIDDSIGNTCLWVVINETNGTNGTDGSYTIAVSVPAGNYTATGFTNALNTAFNTAFNTTTATDWTPISYNANNGKITLSLDKGIYTDPDTGTETTMSPETTTLIFYDFSDTLQCVNTCASKNDRVFNGTLGWLMGYRLPYMAITAEGNEASSIIDLNGTKYLLLVIDDYNQNHVNNSLVSITQFNNTLKMPSFYSPDIPYTCVTPAQRGGNNLAQLMQSIGNEDSAQNGLMIGDKYGQSYKTTQQLLPSAPRTLTKAQLYAANEITQNRATMTSHLSKAPTSSDIFAVIPIKTSVGVPTGSLLVEFSGSLQDSCRTYFGPVNIERMAVRLLDDKGRVLNLHGTDWCVTLVCECLYQY